MIRYWKLTRNTWMQRLREAIDRVRVCYEQRTCPHVWRAVRLKDTPGRLCKICDLAQPLSREDFYAQFGERYAAMLYTQPHAAVLTKDAAMAHIETETIQ